MKKLLLATTALTFALPTFAETLLDKATAEKYSTTTLTRNQLNRDGGNETLKSLRFIPGVSYEGVAIDRGVLSIRGYGDTLTNMGTKKVTISIDGIGTESNGYRQPTFFGDTEMYKKADVTIGSGIRAIGGGIAGNVNFVTKDTADLLKGRKSVYGVSTGFSTNENEMHISATQGHKFNSKVSGFANYSYRRSGEKTQGLAAAGAGSQNKANSSTNNDSVLVKLNGKTNVDKWEIKFQQFKFDKIDFTALGESTTTAQGGIPAKVKVRDLKASYVHDVKGNSINNIEFSMGQNNVKSDRSFINTSNNATGEVRKFTTNQFELTANGEKSKNYFSFGLQFRDRLGDELSVTAADRSDKYYTLVQEKKLGIPSSERANKSYIRHTFMNGSQKHSKTGTPSSGNGVFGFRLKDKTYCSVASRLSRCIKSGNKYYYSSGTSPRTSTSSTYNYYQQPDGSFSTTASSTGNASKYTVTTPKNPNTLYGNQQIVGVFGENKFKLNNKTTLVFGVRADMVKWKPNAKQVGVAERLTAYKKTATALKTKGFYSLNKNVVLRVGVSSAQQIFSTRDALYRDSGTRHKITGHNVRYGNTQVEEWWGSMNSAKLPRMNTLSTGIRYNKGKLTVDAEIYRNTLKNELVRSYGIYNSKSYGYDGSVSYKYSPKLSFTGTFQQVNGIYTDVVKRNTGQVWGSTAPVKGDNYTAKPATLTLSATYRPKSNLLLSGVLETIKKNTKFTAQDHRAGYGVLNLYATYSPDEFAKQNGKLKFGITNVGNKGSDADDVSQYDGKSRSITIKYSFDF